MEATIAVAGNAETIVVGLCIYRKIKGLYSGNKHSTNLQKEWNYNQLLQTAIKWSTKKP